MSILLTFKFLLTTKNVSGEKHIEGQNKVLLFPALENKKLLIQTDSVLHLIP